MTYRGAYSVEAWAVAWLQAQGMGHYPNLPFALARDVRARITELERERDEALAARDFFDAERMKVVAQLEAAEAARAAMTKRFEEECDAHEHTGKQRDEYRAALAAEKEGRRPAEERAERLRYECVVTRTYIPMVPPAVLYARQCGRPGDLDAPTETP